MPSDDAAPAVLLRVSGFVGEDPAALAARAAGPGSAVLSARATGAGRPLLVIRAGRAIEAGRASIIATLLAKSP